MADTLGADRPRTPTGTTAGIHHVTAISGPARRNLDFYGRVLGLRLVKRTVNFDDPGTLHLYYGDAGGTPGSIVTFFPWAHAAPGRAGIGETQETALRVPAGAIGWWLHRFVASGVPHEAPETRFGETRLAFRDPDGMRLALVAVPGAEAEAGWTTADIPGDVAIRGLHGVTLLLERAEATAAVLTDVLGFAEAGREESVTRLTAAGVVGGAGVGGIVDLRAVGGFLPHRFGAGSVHHVAFRAADDTAQAAMVRRLAEEHGIRATEQKDRNYFRSVYFREPGGVLFEIATDEPGFAVDEPAAELGTTLRLPPFLEARRPAIERALPDLG